jgi:hypothetical protein
VKSIVSRAAEMNQRAVGLTDHGNMAGSVELYTECAKQGLLPFPGSELYFVPNTAQHKLDYRNKEVKASRFHLGVLAFSTVGYTNLVHLSTLSHRNHFHKPLTDFEMLAQLAEDGRTEGLAVTTGCFFGYAAQTLIKRGQAGVGGLPQGTGHLVPGLGVRGDPEPSHRTMTRSGAMSMSRTDWWRSGSPWSTLWSSPRTPTISDRKIVSDHESLKRLVSWGPDPDDAVFPGDGFHLADESWIQDHHREDHLERGLEGLGDLLSRHQLNIEVLDSYAYSIPRVSARPGSR